MTMRMQAYGGGSFCAEDALQDSLDREERDRLESALAEADAELDRGEGIPAEQFLADLQARSRR